MNYTEDINKFFITINNFKYIYEYNIFIELKQFLFLNENESIKNKLIDYIIEFNIEFEKYKDICEKTPYKTIERFKSASNILAKLENILTKYCDYTRNKYQQFLHQNEEIKPIILSYLKNSTIISNDGSIRNINDIKHKYPIYKNTDKQIIINNIYNELNNIIISISSFNICLINNCNNNFILKDGQFTRQFIIDILKYIGEISDKTYIFNNVINQNLYNYCNNDTNWEKINQVKIYGNLDSFSNTLKKMENTKHKKELEKYINFLKNELKNDNKNDDKNKDDYKKIYNSSIHSILNGNGFNFRNLRDHYGINMNNEIKIEYKNDKYPDNKYPDVYQHNYMNIWIKREDDNILKNKQIEPIKLHKLLDNLCIECKILFEYVKNLFNILPEN